MLSVFGSDSSFVVCCAFRMQPNTSAKRLGKLRRRCEIQKRLIPYILNGRRYLLDRLDLDLYIEKVKIGAAEV
jgi:hypothetical protein